MAPRGNSVPSAVYGGGRDVGTVAGWSRCEGQRLGGRGGQSLRGQLGEAGRDRGT